MILSSAIFLMKETHFCLFSFLEAGTDYWLFRPFQKEKLIWDTRDGIN